MDPELATSLGVMPGTTIAVDQSSAFGSAGSFGAVAGSGTGQQGITPMGGIAGYAGSAVNSVWNWLNTPFNRPMSPTTIFGIVGSILIAIILWNLVLYHVRIAAETI